MKLMKAVMWPLLLLALASMLIYMSGLAAVQQVCQAQETPPVISGGVFGMSALPDDCVRTYRFYWFTFAFVLVTLLGLLVTSFIGLKVHTSRPFWVGMLTIRIILMMIASETFLAFTDVTENVNNDILPQWINRVRTTTVGAIMSVAFLVSLMLVVGTDWEQEPATPAADKPVASVAQV